MRKRNFFDDYRDFMQDIGVVVDKHKKVIEQAEAEEVGEDVETEAEEVTENAEAEGETEAEDSKKEEE